MAEALQSRLLGDFAHGFSTRMGLAADDVLPGAVLVQARQVHSPDAVIVTAPWDTPPDADALVTRTPGMVLGVVTADCAPILLGDAEAGVIGAAHAGWRGAHSGVIENTLAAMEELGADRARIRAAIGPCIAQGSYEVDGPFREQFGEDDARYFATGQAGRWQFNLPAYVAARLTAAGVPNVDDLTLDTYANDGRFYSYRRATHRGEPTGGRQVSMIGLAG